LIESNIAVERLGKAGRPRKSRSGFQKWEIEKFLAEGERVAGVYVVSRADDPLPSRYAPSLDFCVLGAAAAPPRTQQGVHTRFLSGQPTDRSGFLT
jgi:hypothetical protein